MLRVRFCEYNGDLELGVLVVFLRICEAEFLDQLLPPEFIYGIVRFRLSFVNETDGVVLDPAFELSQAVFRVAQPLLDVIIRDFDNQFLVYGH